VEGTVVFNKILDGLRLMQECRRFTKPPPPPVGSNIALTVLDTLLRAFHLIDPKSAVRSFQG